MCQNSLLCVLVIQQDFWESSNIDQKRKPSTQVVLPPLNPLKTKFENELPEDLLEEEEPDATWQLVQ